VTVTLPAALVEDIDRHERNRSRFVADAIRRELSRRRRAGLLRSLARPHPESVALAENGVADWADSLPSGDEDLVEPGAGKPVRWVEGRGWVEEPS